MDLNIEGKNTKYTKLYGDIELKKWFIKEGEKISESTKIGYEATMRKVSWYEKNYMNGRDLYNFSKNDILNMFITFASSSRKSLEVYLSNIKNYIELAITSNRLRTNINVANNIKKEELDNIVNKIKNKAKFITKEDLLNEIKEKIANPQDKVIVLLQYLGLTQQEVSDLKQENIDLKNNLIIFYRNNQKIVKYISNELNNIFEIYNNSKFYKGNNGEGRLSKGKQAKYALFINLLSKDETPYFIRPMEKEKRIKLSSRTIQNRTYRILKKYLNMPYFSPSDLYKIGLIERIQQYVKQNNIKVSHLFIQNYLKENDENFNSNNIWELYKGIKGIE